MTTRQFIIFNVAFWLVTTLVLFTGGLHIAPNGIRIAFVRYFYFLVTSVLISLVLSTFYSSAYFKRKKSRLVVIIFVCIFAAFTTAILVNPVTFLMRGFQISETFHDILSSGTLRFVLIYFAWSALYFQLNDNSMIKGGEAATDEKETQSFWVEKQGKKRLLKDSDLCCVSASGDYVELVTAQNTYLIKETISGLEARLDVERFRRVHRSTIINLDKVESVAPKTGGAYYIALDGGHTIQSSRSYKAVVESILRTA